VESIKIDTGEKRIAINNDPDRVIVFNPRDTLFMERFYKICQDIALKMAEYQKQGQPEGIEFQFTILQEANTFMRERIDYAFGVGTSYKCFEDTVSYDFGMYSQFIDGIKSFIEPVRAEKIKQYLPTANGNGKKKSTHKRK
jgi:hypothetical protein